MTRATEGEIIQAGINQIQQSYELSESERELAKILAPYIQSSKKIKIAKVGSEQITQPYNWVAVYVQEKGNRNYEVVGSPVVLEACRIAGLQSISCLQIDASKEAEEQVQGFFDNMSPDPPISLLRLQSSVKELEFKIDQLQQDISQSITEKFEEIIGRLPPPPPKLLINSISEDELLQKIKSVKGFGGNGVIARNTVDAILEYRPFFSEDELVSSIPKFKTKRGEKTQNFKNFISAYVIDYSLND